MELVTRTGMDKIWSGFRVGMDIFFVKSFGAGWVMGKDAKMSAKYLLPLFFPSSMK